MRLSSIAIIATAFGAAAGASLLAAGFVVTTIEQTSESGVRDAFDNAGLTWAEVQAGGLEVTVTGTAPSEALRFKAITTAGTVVDAARVVDAMNVESAQDIIAPDFSLEILRNDSGVSVMGLIPAGSNPEALIESISTIAGDSDVADLLEIADYPVPDNWNVSMDFAIEALRTLPRSKISADAERVAVTAMADSEKNKRDIKTHLATQTPDGVRLALDISAPRPVITPFTLRFLKTETGTKFDACSAESAESRDRILSAAGKAGLAEKTPCTIGLGVPTPKWSEAVEKSIAAVNELGAGTVTFSDADITLVAAEGTPQDKFDDIIGRLENSLPEVFALHSILPEIKNEAEGPPEFLAIRSPEGQIQLRGRVNNDVTRDAAESFAKARFGSSDIVVAARVVDDLPSDWTLRVLAGLEALGQLENGHVIVTPEEVSVKGNTGNQNAKAEIAGFLADKLGESQRFKIDVTYLRKLDPILGLPTPDECQADVNKILAERKITFEPGSATPDSKTTSVLDALAGILKRCEDMGFEIAGYTDSQGRESMNLELSQQRADAVLNALRDRRVLTSDYRAEGYGESDPIADNSTEEGREANRRIEFKLIR